MCVIHVFVCVYLCALRINTIYSRLVDISFVLNLECCGICETKKGLVGGVWCGEPLVACDEELRDV